MERKIEQLYENISFTPEFTKFMQDLVDKQIDNLAEAAKEEQKKFKLEKDKLAREQYKLLQAHYEDAIPLTILKREQKRISKTLNNIDIQIKARDMELESAKENIHYVFELLENCGVFYKIAADQGNRCLTQALFKRILVNDDLSLSVEYNEPFGAIINSNVRCLKEDTNGIKINVGDQQSQSLSAYIENEQPIQAAHSIVSTKTCPKNKFFSSAGFNTDYLCCDVVYGYH